MEYALYAVTLYICGKALEKGKRIVMIYQINNGLVKYAADTILDHINFEIRNTEKNSSSRS